jgi:hypothetical protein
LSLSDFFNFDDILGSIIILQAYSHPYLFS